MEGYIAAAVVVVIALLIFYKPISRLIDRISGASRDGITFERPQEGADVTPAPMPFLEIMKLPISPSALEREKMIEKQAQALALKNEAEKITILTRVLAHTQVELDFTKIANTIFGSQVTLLVQLVGSRSSIPRQQAETIFEQAQKAFPDLHSGKQFDNWFAFLQSANLATSINSQIDITQFGKDFLKYLVDSRIAHNRYG